LYFVPWGAGTGAPERSEDMAHEAKNAGAAAPRVAQLMTGGAQMNCPALADRPNEWIGAKPSCIGRIALAPVGRFLGATAALGVGGHSNNMSTAAPRIGSTCITSTTR
jgi:hypothetical protein